MKQLKIGNMSLGSAPLIVTVIDKMLPMAKIAKIIAKGANILELRADLFDQPLNVFVKYLEKLKKKINIPLIGTVRSNLRTQRSLFQWYKEILPLVDCIDVEVESVSSLDISSICGKIPVIISHHNFKVTPSISKLHQIAARCAKSGADIVKIVTMARSQKDVVRLIQFIVSYQGKLVAFAMGEHGSISRIITPLFGSLFTYTHSGKAVAPGQLPLKQTVQLLDLFYPQRKHLIHKNNQ